MTRCTQSPKAKALPQILDVDSEEQDGATHNAHTAKKTKCAVIKTSTRQTVFLPMIGLVPHDKLIPGDLIGVNKDSYLILEKLPAGAFRLIQPRLTRQNTMLE